MYKKEVLLKGITQLPKQIYSEESKYYDALGKVKEAKFKLASLESDLFQEGKINGTNEKARQAQVIFHTKNAQLELIKAEVLAEQAKAQWNLRRNELEVVKIVLEFGTVKEKQNTQTF
ncbi:hypothetical protein ABLO26_03665 [Neobacillus sp. 179-J 1A1 HS]|uniref:hypothetical protein n=1 Tax=Neobacillus driksii TaxID=3035913 RepID=UPI0035BBE85F